MQGCRTNLQGYVWIARQNFFAGHETRNAKESTSAHHVREYVPRRMRPAE